MKCNVGLAGPVPPSQQCSLQVGRDMELSYWCQSLRTAAVGLRNEQPCFYERGQKEAEGGLAGPSEK